MIRSFKDLTAWQHSMTVAAEVYQVTSAFPSEERFGIVNQLRRAAVSVSSNIAEGFGRNSRKEKDQFYAIAYGSLLEVESQIILSVKLGFLPQNTAQSVLDVVAEAQKTLAGLQRANKARKE